MTAASHRDDFRDLGDEFLERPRFEVFRKGSLGAYSQTTVHDIVTRRDEEHARYLDASYGDMT